MPLTGVRIYQSSCDFGCKLLEEKISEGISLGCDVLAQTEKNLPAMWETQVRSLGQKDPLEKELATHSRILAWRILWTEEPGGL